MTAKAMVRSRGFTNRVEVADASVSHQTQKTDRAEEKTSLETPINIPQIKDNPLYRGEYQSEDIKHGKNLSVECTQSATGCECKRITRKHQSAE